jgi:streptogramin lyase
MMTMTPRLVPKILCFLALSVCAAASNAQYQERVINDTSVIDLVVASDGAVYYVDGFGNELGLLDVTTGTRTPLLSNLRYPHHAVEVGRRLYFTEFGTDRQRYTDGALSEFDLETHAFTRLREDLRAPTAIDADSAGNLFVLEVPATSTRYPDTGTNRVLKFAPEQTDFTVLIDFFPISPTPVALLVDEDKGRLYLSNFGTSLPSDGGALVQYDLKTAQWSTLLENLPTIWDMQFDRDGNILMAGMGADGGTLRAASYVPPSLDAFIPIRTGLGAWSVASDAGGSIYFSTLDRSTLNQSVRVLSMIPEPASLALLALAIPALVRRQRL